VSVHCEKQAPVCQCPTHPLQETHNASADSSVPEGEDEGALGAVYHGLQDSVMSVRIASCWAMANILDSLWDVQQRGGCSSSLVCGGGGPAVGGVCGVGGDVRGSSPVCGGGGPAVGGAIGVGGDVRGSSPVCGGGGPAVGGASGVCGGVRGSVGVDAHLEGIGSSLGALSLTHGCGSTAAAGGVLLPPPPPPPPHTPGDSPSSHPTEHTPHQQGHTQVVWQNQKHTWPPHHCHHHHRDHRNHHLSHNTQSLQPHQLQHLARVRDAAVAAAQGDADKVRANGVRAVGGLLGLLSAETAQQAGMDVDRCVCVCVCVCGGGGV